MIQLYEISTLVKTVERENSLVVAWAGAGVGVRTDYKKTQGNFLGS